MYQFLRSIKWFYVRVSSYIKFIFVAADYITFFRKNTAKRFSAPLLDVLPCLFENIPYTRFDTHYVYHTGWAARKVREIGASKHVDISSSLYFSSIVSAFTVVEFYDFRPANLNLPGLVSKANNLLNLSFKDNSIESLSCMHTVEHVGLGRYGDTIDPDGDIAAAKELSRVLSYGGSLVFVVPVGKPRIQFNAHRIYSYDMVLALFPDLILKEVSLIPDDALSVGMIYHATKTQVNSQTYGCGCFVFTKRNAH
jgi:hypothetical protein